MVISPKHMGQNFLIDRNITRKIVRQALLLSPSLLCDEIGAGTGNLTTALLAAGFQVTAIEKDTRLIPTLKTHDRLHLLHQDILHWTPPSTTQKRLCIGNIPYSLTTPICLWLKKFRTHYHHALFTVQKEVAVRLTSEAGVASPMDVLVFYCNFIFKFTSCLTFLVPVFAPCHRWTPCWFYSLPRPQQIFTDIEQEQAFSKFTQLLFHQRRKTLGKILQKQGIHCRQEINKARPETLSPQEILNLFYSCVDTSSKEVVSAARSKK